MIYSKHHVMEPGKATSTLLLAGSGSGKSDWIKSNLLQMDENFIVVDPGGEYVKTVGKALKEHGYKIQVLNLDHPDRGAHYNPFSFDFENSRIQNLVDSFLKNIKDEKEDFCF